MTDSVVTNKRTRSQTTLDAFAFVNLAASPLKQARSALKHPDQPLSSSPPPAPDSAPNDLKRPPSPSKDAALLPQHDLKRPRHHLPNPPPHPHVPPRRARSVPPVSISLPLLDLNNVPSSPRRSPSKFRIASVPPQQLPLPSPDPLPIPHHLTLPPTISLNIPTPVASANTRPQTPMSPLTPLPSSTSLHPHATTLPPPTSLLLISSPTPAPSSPPLFSLPPVPTPSSSSLPQRMLPRAAVGVKGRMKPKGKHPPPHTAPPKKVRNPRDTNRKPSLGPPPKRMSSRAASSRSRSNPVQVQDPSQLPQLLQPLLVPTHTQSVQSPTNPASSHQSQTHTHPHPPHRRRSQSLSAHPSYAKPTSSSAARASPVKPSAVPSSSAAANPDFRFNSARPGATTPKQLNATTPSAITFPAFPVQRKTPTPSSTASKGKQVPQGSILSSTDVGDHAHHDLTTKASQNGIAEAQSRLHHFFGLKPPSHSEENSTSAPIHPYPKVDLDTQTRLADIVPANPERNALVDQAVPALAQDDVPMQSQFAHRQFREVDSSLSDLSDLTPNSEDETSPPSAIHRAPLQLNSSLSELTDALARINEPAPVRPNTSMGFHRSLSENEDDHLSSSDAGIVEVGHSTGVMRGGRSGKGVRRGTGSRGRIPRPGPAMARPAPAKGKRNATAALATPAGQKKMKQTTLMLPPPVPAHGVETRTGLRSAAATTSSSNHAGATAVATNGHRTLFKEVGTLTSGSRAGHELANVSSTTASLATTDSVAGPSTTTSSIRTLVTTLNAIGRPVARVAGLQKRPFTIGLGGGRGGAASAKPVFGVGRFGADPSMNGARRGGALQPVRGAMRGRMGLPGSRVAQKVSKASSLPVVVGSPVKGGTVHEEDPMDIAEVTGDTPMDATEGVGGSEGLTTKDKIGAWLRNASKEVLKDLGHSSDEDVDVDESKPSAEVKGDLADGANKEKEPRRNATRRASMARHLLSQSLSVLPSTPSKTADSADAKGKGRAVSSSWPTSVGAASSDANASNGVTGVEAPNGTPALAPRAHATRLATGALTTPPNAYTERSLRSSGGSAEGKGKGKQEESPGVLSVLRDCRVFVDVKTDEGDDAGGLFVDMLQDMGAKIATRVGSKCTHVVFKNGLMSTLTRYRTLKAPKPLVVGIAWVVECVEQRKRVDETRFLQNLDLENVAGVNKRRKSMAPKHYSPVASKIASPPFHETVLTMGIGGVTRLAGTSRAAEESIELSSPTTVDDDGDRSMQILPPVVAGSLTGSDTAAGTVDGDELTPLERARRRRSMLPGR